MKKSLPFPAGPPVLPNPNANPNSKHQSRWERSPDREAEMHGARTLRGEAAGPTKTKTKSPRPQPQTPIPVGAVAWPRSRMHRASPIPGGAAGPTKPNPNPQPQTPIPVGAAAWPRSRMHRASPIPGGAAGPTNPNPSPNPIHQSRWERPPGREAECIVPDPFPAGPPVLPRPGEGFYRRRKYGNINQCNPRKARSHNNPSTPITTIPAMMSSTCTNRRARIIIAPIPSVAATISAITR